MYLTEINKKTGLLYYEGEYDGIFAVKAFRDVLMDESLRFDSKEEYPGIHCMTAIALVVDNLSVVRFYSEKDRPKAAMEEVTGKREAFNWPYDPIQIALKRYDELQYDPTLEEGKIHYQRKVTMMERLREAEEKYNKGIKDENGKEILFENPKNVAASLRDVNNDIKEYEKIIQGKDVYEKSPVRNGYKLSRLEQKIEKKNSFYKEKR